MAIYHLSVKIISRGKGQNALASAAYRSGELLLDEQENEIKYYSRSVAPISIILAPDHAPKWVQDRQTLWNEVERSEKRVNSQLAREFELALPIELPLEKQKELLATFIYDNCVKKGMIADASIHLDHPENPHAHVMLTTREITSRGFGEKNREWNQKSYLEEVREQWANYANKALESVNSLERIDHRSFKERGIELLPTKHVGVAAAAMEKKGIETDKVKRNKEIHDYNRKILSLEAKKEQLLENGAYESDHAKDRHQLVVTYSTYMNNQRNMRIAFNKKTYYEQKSKRLAKEGKLLSDFESEALEKSKQEIKEYTKIKFDFVKHVEEFLNGKDSLFSVFAKEFATKHVDKVVSKIKNVEQKEKQRERIIKRMTQEISVRLANKIKELNTNDFTTIVTQTEKDMYFSHARKIVKSWTDYDSITTKLDELEKEVTLNGRDTPELSKKELKAYKDIAVLKYVKEFYEVQAIHALQQAGFDSLVEKYDSPNYQPILVSMYKELLKNPNKVFKEQELESRTMNTFKLDKAKNLVRGELTGANIERKLGSIQGWQSSLERMIQKGEAERLDPSKFDPEKLEKNKAALQQAKESIQTLEETKRILFVRANEYLKENKEIKKIVEGIKLSPQQHLHDPIGMDMKKIANATLFMEADKYTKAELVGKIYDNVLDAKQVTSEIEAKHVLYRHEYQTYRATVSNLDNYKRFLEEHKERYEGASKRLESYESRIREYESKWRERDSLNKKPKIVSFAYGEKIQELNKWFEESKIDAKSLAGGLAQLEYQYRQDVWIAKKYEMTEQVKVPALENMKLIKENKAIREIERDFKLQPSYEFKIVVSPEERELFANYSDLKRQYGESMQFDELKEKIGNMTADVEASKEKLATLDKLIEQANEKHKMIEQFASVKMEAIKNDVTLGTEEKKEKLDSVIQFRNSQFEKASVEMKAKRTEYKQEQEKYYNAVSAKAITNKIGNAVESLKIKVSEAEMNRERNKRLRGLKKEEELQQELRRTR